MEFGVVGIRIADFFFLGVKSKDVFCRIAIGVCLGKQLELYCMEIQDGGSVR